MLSPTGRSRMWDAAADGYARGVSAYFFLCKGSADGDVDRRALDALCSKRCPRLLPMATASIASSVRRESARTAGRRASRCRATLHRRR
ncbi:hypothetical protein M3J09_001384 [Ascochyta lentis]